MRRLTMKPHHHISLESVLEEPLAFRFELPFSLAALDREPLVEITPARIEGEVSRIEAGYSLNARLSYAGKLECSRCLAAYPFETDETFSLLLYKRPAQPEKEVSLDKDDPDIYFYEELDLPLAPIAEERIQIGIPMKPLCREDCRGVCARCGEDLNVAECGCPAEVPDPRWEAIRALPPPVGAARRTQDLHFKKE